MVNQYKSWNDLSPAQRLMIENNPDFTCGTMTNKVFRLPNFCFEASCKAHDYAFRHGKGPRDFVRANNGFVKRMFKDIWRKDDAYLNKAFYYLMATLYYITVSTLGIFAFNWSRQYKSIEQILQEVS